jgi:hypothetical protein
MWATVKIVFVVARIRFGTQIISSCRTEFLSTEVCVCTRERDILFGAQFCL